MPVMSIEWMTFVPTGSAGTSFMQPALGPDGRPPAPVVPPVAIAPAVPPPPVPDTTVPPAPAVPGPAPACPLPEPAAPDPAAPLAVLPAAPLASEPAAPLPLPAVPLVVVPAAPVPASPVPAVPEPAVPEPAPAVPPPPVPSGVDAPPLQPIAIAPRTPSQASWRENMRGTSLSTFRQNPARVNLDQPHRARDDCTAPRGTCRDALGSAVRWSPRDLTGVSNAREASRSSSWRFVVFRWPAAEPLRHPRPPTSAAEKRRRPATRPSNACRSTSRPIRRS